MLVVIHNEDDSFSCRKPLLYQCDEVFSKENQGACEILLLRDEELAFLLVASPGVDVLVFAWVVGGDDARLVSLCAP